MQIVVRCCLTGPGRGPQLMQLSRVRRSGEYEADLAMDIGWTLKPSRESTRLFSLTSVKRETWE